METFSYNELKACILEDIEEFMNDGLDIRQATSKVQVEYEKAIKENTFYKLSIYLALCAEGIKHGFLRDDIREHTRELLSDQKAIPQDLSAQERTIFYADIESIREVISGIE